MFKLIYSVYKLVHSMRKWEVNKIFIKYMLPIWGSKIEWWFESIINGIENHF